MKHIKNLFKTIILLNIIFILQTAQGQKLKTNHSIKNPDNILHLFVTDFERNYSTTWVTDTINPWVIDTLNPNNIWQIGKPQKQSFDSSLSLPNAIITDTINTYPINNYSSFQINLKKPQWAISQGRGWSVVHLFFYHKYNTDSLSDGGYIDVSYDGGNTFNNIIFDSNFSEHHLFIYKETDTIIGGIPAFCGNSGANWVDTQLQLRWEEKDYYKVDSMIIRFNFKSDGTDTQKEGWIIDDIFCEVRGYFPSSSNAKQNIPATEYYPNPVRHSLTLELSDKYYWQSVEIISLTGQIIETILQPQSKQNIELHKFKPSIFILKATTSCGKVFSEKIIKQ